MNMIKFKKTLNQFWLIIIFQSAFNFAGRSQEAINPATALQHYLHNYDTSYHWQQDKSTTVKGATIYTLLLTSQKWRQFTWVHHLEIIVPSTARHDGALLFITGGSVSNGLPNPDNANDKLMPHLTQIALKNQEIVAVLRQTPNQPLFDSLNEDALISYTLHQFEGDRDYSWPLLFPMVKSAVKAMDAIQEFVHKQFHFSINQFVISGASKRGWTTWLTGANDPRVIAICPMVIDIVNMPVNLDYQIKAWNEYSIQIEDYVRLGIVQRSQSVGGSEIISMVDPYSYRATLIMPKMIIMGTNDEYWVIDAIKNYYDSIPGKNLIHYVPNVGHGLGDGTDAFNSLSAFFAMTMSGKLYNACSWSVSSAKRKVEVNIEATSKALVGADLWSATSKNMVFTQATWKKNVIVLKNKERIKVVESLPYAGNKAFYVDLIYKNPKGGVYRQSTRMFVMDSTKLKLN
ncbi:MAG: PhoPQ-activated pathogenicity-related family protein [Flavisolibacter sp.]